MNQLVYNYLNQLSQKMLHFFLKLVKILINLF